MKPYIDLRIKRFATFSEQASFETLDDLHIGTYIIPRGFETDGASLPRWAIFTSILLIIAGGFSSGVIAKLAMSLGVFAIIMAYLIPPFGRYTLATFLHDKLLEDMPRVDADREMKRVLKSLGVSGFWQTSMYRLVRINSFLKHREMG